MSTLTKGNSIFNFDWVAGLKPEDLADLARSSEACTIPEMFNKKGLGDWLSSMAGLIEALTVRGLHTRRTVQLLPAEAWGEWWPGEGRLSLRGRHTEPNEFELQLRLLSCFSPVAVGTSMPASARNWCLYQAKNQQGVVFCILTLYDGDDESPTTFYYPFVVVE